MAPENVDLKAYWHTTSHVLAQAVKRLFPEVKLGIGPAIEKGFYYDFYRSQPFTPDDLVRLEKEMETIVRANLPVTRADVSREEAERMEKDEPFKLEILRDIPDATVSFYTQGEFTDLCAGPHLEATGRARNFKLLSIAASYWKGDENRESMQRIYGISFPDKKQLHEYLAFLEEARQRDHRTLGARLDLFSIHPEFGSGLIFWHPKGALVRKIIEDFWKNEHLRRGYELLSTPHVADVRLWETSGHTGFYRDYMYPVMELDKDRAMQLKPMNCPFHILIYKNRTRSYRELPIRWAEMGTVYRMEKQGVLHGLMRVRGFTQDDAHVFCTPAQLPGEIAGIIELTRFFLGSFGFSDYEVFLSTRPDKFVGTPEHWEQATSALEQALKAGNVAYQTDPGEGVFYGPKIDIKIKDCLGRAWQCSTIQVDFNIPERFGLKYVDETGVEVTPIMIHRAILGSLERFFGVLIEHYKGAFPLWLAPVQARILPIADRHQEAAARLRDRLAERYRADLDVRNEKINKKIRDAEEDKVPCMLVLGDREIEENRIAVRRHGRGMTGTLTFEELTAGLDREIETRGREPF